MAFYIDVPSCTVLFKFPSGGFKGGVNSSFDPELDLKIQVLRKFNWKVRPVQIIQFSNPAKKNGSKYYFSAKKALQVPFHVLESEKERETFPEIGPFAPLAYRRFFIFNKNPEDFGGQSSGKLSFWENAQFFFSIMLIFSEMLSF